MKSVISKNNTEVTYAELYRQASDQRDKVKDNAQARYEMREDYYRKYGFVEGTEFGYGKSELQFMKWEMKRGVLNTPDKEGSPWWNSINLEFGFYSELAGLMFEAGCVDPKTAVQVQAWLTYLNDPGPITWFKAHNTTITMCYFNYRDLAYKESVYERIFMNEVFYRLLYAQALVDGKSKNFKVLGKLLANPAVGAISDFVLVMDDLYPDNYPLTLEDINHILHHGRSAEVLIGQIMDYVLIDPQLTELYEHAMVCNGTPIVMQFIDDHTPIYPRVHADLVDQEEIGGPVEGDCQSFMALLEMDKAQVLKLFPPEVTLVDQNIASEGKHPVFWFVNHNKLHSSWFSWPSITYNEIAFLVPYSEYKGKTYSFTPLLYVDNWIVAFLGKVVWKFNKMLAKFGFSCKFISGPAWFADFKKFDYTVTGEDAKELSGAKLKNEGEFDYWANLKNMKVLQELLDQPGLMGTSGKFMGVTVQMDYNKAQIQPMEGELEIKNIPGFTDSKFDIKSIRNTVFGGFRNNWHLKLSWPKKL